MNIQVFTRYNRQFSDDADEKNGEVEPVYWNNFFSVMHDTVFFQMRRIQDRYGVFRMANGRNGQT